MGEIGWQILLRFDMILKSKTGDILLGLLVLLALIAIGYMGEIKQDLTYHKLVDNRIILGIPNFWNVISSLSFLLVGFLGNPSYSYFG